MEGDARLLQGRVNRVVGQLQGVGRMIAENRDCPGILHTISAVHAALRSLEAKLLEDHVRHCITDAACDPERLEQRLEEMIQLYRRRLS